MHKTAAPNIRIAKKLNITPENQICALFQRNHQTEFDTEDQLTERLLLNLQDVCHPIHHHDTENQNILR